MDIMMPPLQQQPSPAPWLVRAARVDLARLVAEARTHWPEANVDEVIGQLAEYRQVQTSGIIVSMLLSKWKPPAVNENEPQCGLVESSTFRPAMVALKSQEWTVGL